MTHILACYQTARAECQKSISSLPPPQKPTLIFLNRMRKRASFWNQTAIPSIDPKKKPQKHTKRKETRMKHKSSKSSLPYDVVVMLIVIARNPTTPTPKRKIETNNQYYAMPMLYARV